MTKASGCVMIGDIGYTELEYGVSVSLVPFSVWSTSFILLVG